MIKKLLGEAAVYGLSSILGRAVNFLMVPVYTGIFLPEEYGIVTELYAYMAFFNVLFTYGMETAFFRFSTKHPEKKTHFFHLAQSSILYSSLILGGVLWAFSDGIGKLLDYQGQGYAIQWLSLVLCLDAIVAIPFAKLRLDGKAGKFAAFKLSNILINVGLNLFFLLLCPFLVAQGLGSDWIFKIYDPNLGVGYVFLSNLLANSLYILFFAKTWKSLKLQLLGVEWRQMLNYALPLLILGFAGVANEMLSRSMLKHRLPDDFYSDLSNLAALGIFGAVYKLAIFMTLVVQAFKYAYEPFFFEKAEEEDSKELNAKVMSSFIAFVCLGWMLLSMILPEIAPIFLRNPSYVQGIHIVPLLLGAGVFLGIFYNLSVWYKLSNNNWLGAYISIGGALGTFVLNWVFIPVFGYLACAWISLITYGGMCIASYTIGKRHYPIPYHITRAIIYLSLALGFALLMINQYQQLWSRYLIGSVALLAFVLLALRQEKLLGFFRFNK